MKEIKKTFRKGVFTLLTMTALAPTGLALTHPGALQTQAAMTNARQKVAAGVAPWSSAWTALSGTDATASYTATVSATITDEYAMQSQGHAAYVLAIKWVASGDISYANAAKGVIDAWVSTVTTISSPNPTLRVGLGAIQMANAAEILATAFNGAAGWPAANVTAARTWFKNKVYPLLSTGTMRSAGWGTPCLAANMAIGIFCNDQTIFDAAVSAYKYGFTNTTDGCCQVTDYIWNASGQCAESGRDQVHPMGAMGHQVEAAMMAWSQGINLVSYGTNRIVAGMEYSAKYNLGNSVSWATSMPDACNVYPAYYETAVSTSNRGEFAPVWEMCERLFTLAGVAHPYTTQVATSSGFRYYPNTTAGGTYRPERTTTDNPGMGTLLYTRDPAGQYIPTGTYRIVSRKSGLLAQADGSPNGSNVSQAVWNGGDGQKWVVNNIGNNQYTFTSMNSGRGMDVVGASMADGANVQIYDLGIAGSGGTNQRWQLTPAPGFSGYYLVAAVHSGKALDVTGQSTAAGANIQQYAPGGGGDGNAGQQWTFQLLQN